MWNWLYQAEISFTNSYDALESLKKSLLNYKIVDSQIRPWGCFVTLDSKDQKSFISEFFPKKFFKEIVNIPGTPKLLCIAPGEKLSRQYHKRRKELWTLWKGTAWFITSPTDDEWVIRSIKKGEVVVINEWIRHRLIGHQGWGIVAEIRQHNDIQHLSDEQDIVRVQDNWGRI